MNAYKLTLSNPMANHSESIIVNLTYEQLALVEECKKTCRYSLYISRVGDEVSNAADYKTLVDTAWLETTKLYRTEQVLSDTKVNIIQLPKYVEGMDDGVLKVNYVADFREHTHDTAVQEVAIMKLLLETFPTAVYYVSRSMIQLLPKVSEDDESKTIVSYTPNRSTTGNIVVEETTRVYSKVEVEL